MRLTLPATHLVEETITDEYIAPKALARVLRVIQTGLSTITGLRREAISKHVAYVVSAPRTPPRNRGNPQPLPSFGDLTAEDLLKAGRPDTLRAYLGGRRGWIRLTEITWCSGIGTACSGIRHGECRIDVIDDFARPPADR